MHKRNTSVRLIVIIKETEIDENISTYEYR